MTTHYYECTIKYDKMQDDGSLKKKSEKFLVEALSFAEAETRLTALMRPFTSGDSDITAIRRLTIAQVFGSDNPKADRWYKGKLAFITLDERSGAEKRNIIHVLVHASDFDDARNAIQNGMKESMADWEKTTLAATSVVDAFLYDR